MKDSNFCERKWLETCTLDVKSLQRIVISIGEISIIWVPGLRK